MLKQMVSFLYHLELLGALYLHVYLPCYDSGLTSGVELNNEPFGSIYSIAGVKFDEISPVGDSYMDDW